MSAGLLVYRLAPGGLEVLLAHPGGPFFRNRDEGAWTIPKGAPTDGEDLTRTALREFEEEIGLPVSGPLLPLGEVRQKGGKLVAAFACAGDAPADFQPRSNLFELEWPPRSGRRVSFPEVDRARFFSLAEARQKINAAQIPLLERLEALLAPGQAPPDQGCKAKQ